jgi:hypothetical protein
LPPSSNLVLGTATRCTLSNILPDIELCKSPTIPSEKEIDNSSSKSSLEHHPGDSALSLVTAFKSGVMEEYNDHRAKIAGRRLFRNMSTSMFSMQMRNADIC